MQGKAKALRTMLEMDKEVISVIVPVFNIEKYLPRCLESIACQTYRDLEIILVDDGSTDSSGSICDDYAEKDSRARVIHQHNRGLWAARNAGQDVATGEYLFFPDGDDYFHHDLLKTLYEAINLVPESDLAMAREKRVWGNDEDVCSPIEPKRIILTRDEMIRNLLAKGDDRFYAFMWNKLYRRGLIEDIRTRNYVRSQDYDFNMRAFLMADSAIIIDNDLYFWLQHRSSLTTAPDSMMMMYSCRTRILYQNFLDLSDENTKYCPAFLSKLYRTMALWKGYSVYSASKKEVCKMCREYESTTWRTYLFGGISGLFERIICLSLLHSPHLTHMLMKATRNL